MPLQLSVALSQKIGQPNFGSLGASCGITLELESRLLELDPAAFQVRVQAAYQACREAIEAELGNHQASQPVGINEETHWREANGPIAGTERLATPTQRWLLARLADHRHVVLEEFLRRHSRQTGASEQRWQSGSFFATICPPVFPRPFLSPGFVALELIEASLAARSHDSARYPVGECRCYKAW